MTAGNAALKVALHRMSTVGARFWVLLWTVSILRSIVSFSLTREVFFYLKDKRQLRVQLFLSDIQKIQVFHGMLDSVPIQVNRKCIY